MADSDGTSCNVCFEPYDLDSKLPRILPCSHSSCESCLEGLIKTNGARKTSTLTCPECRKKHATRSGIEAFPHNRYILNLLKLKKEVEAGKSKKCGNHPQSCAKSNCSVCLPTIRRYHELVDPAHKQTVGSLNDHISEVTKNIEDSLGKFLASKTSVDSKYMQSVQTLRRVKQQYDSVLEELIDGALQQKADFDTQVDRQVENLRARAHKLCDIRNLACNVKTENEVRVLAEKVKGIDQEQKISRQEITYKYHEYDVEKADPLQLKNIRGDLLEEETPTGQCGDLDVNVTGVTIVKVLHDGSFVINGDNDDLSRMVKYDKYGNELFATEWIDAPITDFEEMILGTQACLVISCLCRGLMFRNAENLNDIVLDYDDQDCGETMCASTPTTLLYTRFLDDDTRNVESLNCSKLPLERKVAFHLECESEQMLCVTCDGKRLLLLCYRGKVLAYDATTFLLQWKLNVHHKHIGLQGTFRAKRLTSDGRQLFVMDGQQDRILLCSFKGKFKRILLDGDEKDLGELWDICWSKQRKSLIVARRHNDGRFVTSLSVEN